MYYRMKIFVAVLLLLSVSSIKSDHIEDDCREIHCPKPVFDCPTDSELKSSATDDAEDEDEDSNSNPFDRLADQGLIEAFYPNLFPTPTNPPHLIQKRSLQHRRRETIKIVPGDYRSFEPEFFKYHNHHQPHRKGKRDLTIDVQPHSEAEIKKCCPEFQCICRTCPGAPRCEKGKVAIMVEEGHGLPGSCCSTYECVAEIECNATSQPKNSYWRDACTKCDCFAGQELCQQLCETNEDESANNCFSAYLNRPMMNGDSWLEDSFCKECKCINGDSQCQESYCKPVDCENPMKVEGRCCKVCPLTTSTTTTTTTESQEMSSTTDVPVTTLIPTTKLPVTTSSATQSTTSSTAFITSTTSGPAIQTEKEENDTTFTAPTVIISPPKETSHIIIIIFVTAATVLIVFFACAIVYLLRQRRKTIDSKYSEIPSFESSQSSSVTLA